jgi:uroporphyrinogen decarboxylase
VILFTKGGGAWLERMSLTGVDALGVDWTTELSAARRDTFGRVALQGNLDPARCSRRRGNPLGSRARARELRPRPGMSSNLGHGIQPGVEPEHVASNGRGRGELSPAYHR